MPTGPFGYWTFADIAEDLGLTRNYLQQVLPERGCPRLVPTMRAGNLHLYDDSTARQWLVDYRRFREEAPARNAAMRAEAVARAKAAADAEQARLVADKKVADALQASFNESVQAIEDRRERIQRTGAY